MRLSVSAPCLSLFAVAHCESITGKPEVIRSSVKADVLIGDVTSGNPNVFYEIGLAHAHAFGKPVIFLTQDSPASAPVDVRQFEFFQYDLQRHEEFLSKLDNAIQNVFVFKYEALYQLSQDLLQQFNRGTSSSYVAASLKDFQERVMRGEQTQRIPPAGDKERKRLML